MFNILVRECLSPQLGLLVNDSSVVEFHFNQLFCQICQDQIDPEVTDLINTANMEMLATLVLNGEGSRLVGRRSRNVELQAFLDNVPIYMVSGIYQMTNSTFINF